LSAPPLRGVLFDLDGTLADSLDTIAQAMVEAIALHGHAVTLDDVWQRVGPPMQVLAREVTGATVEEAEAMFRDYLRIYHDRYIRQTPPRAGADALVRRLHDAGLALGVVTNKVEQGARIMVESQGWSDLFRAVAGRDTASESKPHPEAALHVLRLLGVHPNEAAIIGDTEFDMNCGRDAGLAMVIGVTGARSAEHLRAEGATHVVDHLDEVAPLVLERSEVAS
jgi:HAD superfamily hydrolase (TIGR01509 family)